MRMPQSNANVYATKGIANAYATAGNANAYAEKVMRMRMQQDQRECEGGMKGKGATGNERK